MQLTSAPTSTPTARASRMVSHGDGAKKERAPLLEPRPSQAERRGWSLIQAYGSVYSRTAVVATIRKKTDWPLIKGGAAPFPKVLGGLQPPQPPRFLRHCTTADSGNSTRNALLLPKPLRHYRTRTEVSWPQAMQSLYARLFTRVF